MKKKTLLLLILIGWSSIAFAQKDRSLALTPPMGWNSWNTFKSNINETLIKEMADAMVSSGMRDAGYKYLVIDDCWLAPQRDSLQNLQADPKKFPHGMKALGDYIHSKGLKFGIYNCAGTKTCDGFPGTRGHEYQDALLYASWGVDYLKYDWCNTEGINAKEAYTTMSKALEATHRPIVFSLCEWGSNKPWLWAEPVGQLWRATGDISCNWQSITGIIDQVTNLRQYAGPGHWNDPDMLEVGNGLPVNEDRAHFSMWAMLAAPLIAGNDLRNMSEETKAILTNKGVIAIDQDSLGIQGLRYEVKDSVQIWMKPLKGGDWAVCFLNTASQTQAIDFDWKDNVVKDSLSNAGLNANTQPYVIEDLWTNKALGNTNRALKTVVPSDGVMMVYLSKKLVSIRKQPK